MPKMTAEAAKAFLKDDVGFSDEQLAGMNAAQLNKLADAVMRQQDYDSAMNTGKAELAAAQKKLDDANAALNAEMAEWATIQSQGGQITAKMQKDLEAAQAKVAALTARVTHVATQAGIDPKTALDGLETVTPSPAPAPTPGAAPDLAGYVKLEDFNRGYGELAQAALRLPAAFARIQREHTQLFGAPVDEQSIIDEIQSRASTRGNKKSLDPIVIWEEQHKVADKRAEVEAAKRQAEITAAEQRGREAALSEINVPGNHTPTGRHAPVFGAERKSVLQRPQPQSTTNAAAAALRSGKYRQEPTPKSA